MKTIVMPSSYKVRGFTLLEAIVAMVIISILSMSLYSWLNVSYVSSIRAAESLAKSDILLSAKAFMQTVNPMKQPQGTHRVGEYFIKWDSKPITDVTPAYVDSRRSLFDIALYRVEIDLFKGSSELEGILQGSYELELVGYYRAREPLL